MLPLQLIQKGEKWLDELRVYLCENKKIVYEFIEKEIPDLKVLKSEATYLMWLDCSEITKNSSELCNFIREKQDCIFQRV